MGSGVCGNVLCCATKDGIKPSNWILTSRFQTNMNVLWVFAVVTGSTGLVDRPITAGQGNACSSGEDQIKHVGVMIEVFAEEPHVHTMFQAICQTSVDVSQI